jgi:hypothetical protein
MSELPPDVLSIADCGADPGRRKAELHRSTDRYRSLDKDKRALHERGFDLVRRLLQRKKPPPFDQQCPLEPPPIRQIQGPA